MEGKNEGEAPCTGFHLEAVHLIPTRIPLAKPSHTVLLNAKGARKCRFPVNPGRMSGEHLADLSWLTQLVSGRGRT